MHCLINTYSHTIFEPVFDLKNIDSNYTVLYHENKVYLFNVSTDIPSQIFTFVIEKDYDRIVALMYKFLYTQFFFLFQNSSNNKNRLIGIFLETSQLYDHGTVELFNHYTIQKMTYSRSSIFRILATKNNMIYGIEPVIKIDKSIVKIEFGIPYIITYSPSIEYKVDNNVLICNVDADIKFEISEGCFIDTKNKDQYKVI